MLEIDTVYKKGIFFVRLYGVINKNNYKEIESVLYNAIEKVGIKYVLINFENIYYINVNITDIVKKWNNRLEKSDGKLFVCGCEHLNNNFLNITNCVNDLKDEFSIFNIIKI